MDKRTGAKPSKKDSSNARTLNVLLIEDVEDDALLLVRHLEKSGLRIRHQRVDTADGLRAALKNQAWDVVLCDHGLTGFNAMAALRIVNEHGLDPPFIVVSGTIGEEKAAEVMRAGVHDLILKGNLARLAPAIERELREAEARRAKRRADEELDMERRLLQNLMASLPVAIYFKDRQHRYLRLNKVEARILDAANIEAVIGRRADDFLPPGRALTRFEEEERILATGEPLLDRIEEARQRDGTVRWLAATKAPIRDREGNIIGLVGVTRDITRRKKAEDALKESEALFRATIDRAPAAIFINTLDGRYRLVNELACDWYATTAEHIVGKTAGDFLEKKTAEGIRAQERRVLDTRALVEEEVQIAYPDCVTRDVILQKYPILDRKGEILAIGTVIIDMTESRRMERALRASAMRLGGAIDSMQEAFALFDADDRLVAFNAEYARLNPSAPQALEKGLTYERLIRANIERGAIPEAVGREEEFIRERMDHHRNPKGRIIRRFANGKTYFLHEGRTPEGGIALSFVDITELKRMEEGLREKTRQLEVVLESMDQGLYAVDSNLTCTLINRRHAESYGLPPELSRPGVTFEDLARFNARKGRYGPGDVEEHVKRRVELARQNRPLRYEFDLRNGRIVELRSNPLPDGGFVRTSTDITELKRKQEALRESEERFRVVLDSSPSAVTLKGKDGRYQLVNRTFGSWSNCRPEDIIGKTSFDLFPEQEAKKFRDADQAVLASGETAVLEGKITYLSGTVRDAIVQKYPIRSTTGEIIAVATTITDVTEQKRLEEARRQSEARFRIVVDNLPVGINLKDNDGRFVLINKRFEEWYGKAEKEILGKLTEEIIDEPSAVVDARMKQHKAVLEQGKVVSRQEKKKRADGTVHVMELTKFPIIDADGKAPLVGTVAVDITELKRAEEEIRKLSSVVEQSPAGIIITDTKGTIEYVNDAFTQLTGYAAKEAIGRNPSFLKSGETPPKMYESMWETIADGKAWRGTFHNRSKNGALFLAGATIFPITAEDGKISHFVGTHQDITQRVAEQKLLKQAEKMESLGNLAGGIAHDFNNMLLPILALTKMTIKDIPESSGHRERLEKVVQAATRAKDLVAKILTFSRQEDLRQKPIDVGEVIDETLGLLRTTLPSTVTIEDRRSLDGARIFADATQIGTALMNLATNAADAMEGRPGKLEISLTRAEIGVDDAQAPKNVKPGAYAKIRVKDTGHGIDEQTLQRIFEPFFTTKEVGKGTGLGLATVYGIITNHGGVIDVASEIGKGTTFDIYLPLMEEQAGSSRRTTTVDFLQSVD